MAGFIIMMCWAAMWAGELRQVGWPAAQFAAWWVLRVGSDLRRDRLRIDDALVLIKVLAAVMTVGVVFACLGYLTGSSIFTRMIQIGLAVALTSIFTNATNATEQLVERKRWITARTMIDGYAS